MRGIRRKYIALSSMIVFIAIIFLRYISHQDEFSPNESVKIYFEYSVLILQFILTIIVFKTKNNEVKNILTTFNVIITFLYILLYLYSSLSK